MTDKNEQLTICMWVCVLVSVLHVCVHVCVHVSVCVYVCVGVRVHVQVGECNGDLPLSSEAHVWSSLVSVALVSRLPPPPRPAPFFTEVRLLVDAATAGLMPRPRPRPPACFPFTL